MKTNTAAELHALVQDAQDAVERLRQKGLSLLGRSLEYRGLQNSLELEHTLLKIVEALLNGAKQVTGLHQSLISTPTRKKKRSDWQR